MEIKFHTYRTNVPCLSISNPIIILNQIRQQKWEYQETHAANQNDDRLPAHPFPLFQYNAPHIAEDHIQRHQDAPWIY